MTRALPVQARSTKRLSEILDAAVAVIAEKGIERFTSQDVTERAGCSIGTFYRYFEDRVAVLDALYPNRSLVLAPIGPSLNEFQEAAQRAHAVLIDVSLQNPRDRVRGAREVLSKVLGIDE